MEIVCYGLGVIFLGVGLTVALTAFQDAWKADEHVRWLVWGGIAAVSALAGILVGGLPIAYKADAERKPTTDPISEVKTLIAAQKAAELRPYMAVTRVDFSGLKVGEVPRVAITVINKGKTPALKVRAVSRFTFVRIGGSVDRKYEGADIDGSSDTQGPDQGIVMDFASHPLTQGEFDALTNGASELIAHGRVHYESPYIDGGSDDLLICQQYDAASGRMVACRPLMAEFDPPQARNNPIADADRAWITLSYVHLVPPLVVGARPTVRVEFVNSGRTPALDVEIAGNVYSKSSGLPVKIDHSVNGEKKSKVPLGPGVPMTTFLDSIDAFSKQGQIDVILAGTHTLYATGFITYRDSAGNDRRTEFCFKTPAGLKVTDESGYVMVPCQIGNTTT